jgi:hypothetical protein
MNGHMNENPYKSPMASAKPSADKARRALVFRLVVMGGWTFSWEGLIIYGMFAFPPDVLLIIEGTTYLLLYTILSIWIATRVHRGQGIKTTRYLLLGMVPFVAGELATPFFAIATGISMSSPVALITFILTFAHIHSYVRTWRCVILLEREGAKFPVVDPL